MNLNLFLHKWLYSLCIFTIVSFWFILNALLVSILFCKCILPYFFGFSSHQFSTFFVFLPPLLLYVCKHWRFLSLHAPRRQTTFPVLSSYLQTQPEQRVTAGASKSCSTTPPYTPELEGNSGWYFLLSRG